MKSLTNRNIMTFLLTIIALFFAPLTFAKMINLYDQPKADAKILDTLDSEKGIVPIFTGDKGQWMKVGDPKNGNVGWIKISDLADKSGSLSTSLSVTQHIVKTPSGPKTYQQIELATPKPMSDTESQALIKQMQTREQEMQKNMQKMMSDFYKDMNSLYQSNPAVFTQTAFPVVMPIIVVPQPSAAAPTKQTTQPTQTTQPK